MKTLWRKQRADVKLATAAIAWSAVLLLAAAATMPPTFGWAILWAVSVPLELSVFGLFLLWCFHRTGWVSFKVVAVTLCALLAAVIAVSFVTPAFLMLPSCGLLIAACFQPFDSMPTPRSDVGYLSGHS